MSLKNKLPKIIENFNILFPDQESTGIFNTLVNKYEPKGNQVYDFEIISVMKANKIKKIATINEDDFKLIPEIKIIS